MLKLLKILFGFAVFFTVVAVIGRIFFFEIVRTDSYSMIPTLVPGDTILVYRKTAMGPGDIAVCRNPQDPTTLVVGRVLGIPGSTFAMKNNRVVINGEIEEHPMKVGDIIYTDSTSGENMDFLVSLAKESIGGHAFKVAMMDRAGDKSFSNREIDYGFFLIGDNRNRAHDSRHYGEVAIDECIGKAVIILWPGEDCGELRRNKRLFQWLYIY